jgi:NAD(P)-dependent dehydrogenase (short-subunit alcohol dehydrogenase family)
MDELRDKTCIITGGSGSIGLATARLFLAEGARVMLVDIDRAALDRAVAELKSERLDAVLADVAKTEDAKTYVARTVAKWGKIDVLFSNAGNDGPLMPITDYPEDLFDSIVTTHVRGCFLACKYAIPEMNDGGSIIITSSIVGVTGVPFNCSYVTAKHALVGMMRCVAKEVGRRGIRVNTVNPGPVDNDFMRTAERSMSKVIGREAGAFFDEQIPLGRHAKPEEVAEAVAYLASARSKYVSGSMIMVDGGFCA